MSLFTARDWWVSPSAQDTDEEYDVGSLVVGNFDNVNGADDVVITGSLGGLLRVFSPGPSTSVSNTQTVLLETRLSAPILQLAGGRFDPSSPTSHTLAVLHPLRLVVYSVGVTAGEGGGGRTLRKLYEHFFRPHFTAANMAWGAFGSPSSHSHSHSHSNPPPLESIAVQSMDGGLAVFNQAAPGPTAALDTLLPGPLAYLPRSDTLATLTSSMEVVGWKYSALQAAKEGGGVLPPTWAINVGENGAWLLPSKCSSGGGGGASSASASSSSEGGVLDDLLLVGDHSLIHVEDPGLGHLFAGASAHLMAMAAGVSGGGGSAAASALAGNSSVKGHKRLTDTGGGGASPVAAALIPIAGASSASGGGASHHHHHHHHHHHLLLATHSGDAAAPPQLRVYSRGGETLLWSARAPFPPCALAVGRFGGGVAGLVVSLSPRGDCAVTYMGTDPPAVGSQLTGGAGGVDGATSSGGGGVGGEGGGSRDIDVVAEGKKIAAQVKAIQVALGKEITGVSATPPAPVAASAAAAVGKPPTTTTTDSSSSGSVSSSVGSPPVSPLSITINIPSVVELEGGVGGKGGGGGGGDWEDIPSPGSALAGGSVGGGEGEGNSPPGDSPPPPPPLSSAPLPPPTFLPCTVTVKWSPGSSSPPPTSATTLALHLNLPSWVASHRSHRTHRVTRGELLGAGAKGITLPLPLRARSGRAPSGGSISVVGMWEMGGGGGGGVGGIGGGGDAAQLLMAQGEVLRPTVTSILAPLSLACFPVPTAPTSSSAAAAAAGAAAGTAAKHHRYFNTALATHPFKFTLDTGASPPLPLSTLFPDLLGAEVSYPPTLLPPEAAARVRSMAHAALTLKGWDGAEVSILVSNKGAGRYRVTGGASPCPLAPWVLGECVRRLRGVGGVGVAVGAATLVEPLPLGLLEGAIDAHLGARAAREAAIRGLEGGAEEVRVVVRRLLTRFRERTPAALGGLEALCACVVGGAVGGAGGVEVACEAEAACGAGLEAVLAAFHGLLEAKFWGVLGGGGGQQEAVREALQRALPIGVGVGGAGEVGGGGGHGWEERVQASLSALLRRGGWPFGGGGGGLGGEEEEEEGIASASMASSSSASSSLGGLGPRPSNSGRILRLITVLLDRLVSAEAAHK